MRRLKRSSAGSSRHRRASRRGSERRRSRRRGAAEEDHRQDHGEEGCPRPSASTRSDRGEVAEDREGEQDREQGRFQLHSGARQTAAAAVRPRQTNITPMARGVGRFWAMSKGMTKAAGSPPANVVSAVGSYPLRGLIVALPSVGLPQSIEEKSRRAGAVDLLQARAGHPGFAAKRIEEERAVSATLPKTTEGARRRPLKSLKSIAESDQTFGSNLVINGRRGNPFSNPLPLGRSPATWGAAL